MASRPPPGFEQARGAAHATSQPPPGFPPMLGMQQASAAGANTSARPPPGFEGVAQGPAAAGPSQAQVVLPPHLLPQPSAPAVSAAAQHAQSAASPAVCGTGTCRPQEHHRRSVAGSGLPWRFCSSQQHSACQHERPKQQQQCGGWRPARAARPAPCIRAVHHVCACSSIPAAPSKQHGTPCAAPPPPAAPSSNPSNSSRRRW